MSPGKFADIVLFDDIEKFNVHSVIVGGKIKIDNKTPIFKKRKAVFPESLKKSVKVKPVAAKDFIYYSDKNYVTVRAVKYLEFLLTGMEEVKLKVENKNIKSDIENNILKYMIFERYGSNRIIKGFIKDLGIKKLTYASTINWETNQLIVIGANESDMALAVNTIIKLGGGIVLVANGEVVENIPLPVSGVMSELELSVLTKREKMINKLLKDDGCRMENPFLWMQTLSFTGLPYYKLTDKGLVDVRKNKILDVIVD